MSAETPKVIIPQSAAGAAGRAIKYMLDEIKERIQRLPEDHLGRRLLEEEAMAMHDANKVMFSALPAPAEEKPMKYTGHTTCSKCGHVHWMHGTCPGSMGPADGQHSAAAVRAARRIDAGILGGIWDHCDSSIGDIATIIEEELNATPPS